MIWTSITRKLPVETPLLPSTDGDIEEDRRNRTLDRSFPYGMARKELCPQDTVARDPHLQPSRSTGNRFRFRRIRWRKNGRSGNRLLAPITMVHSNIETGHLMPLDLGRSAGMISDDFETTRGNGTTTHSLVSGDNAQSIEMLPCLQKCHSRSSNFRRFSGMMAATSSFVVRFPSCAS